MRRPADSRDAAIGRRINRMRRAQKKSQAQMAEKLGVSRQQFVKYEHGHSVIPGPSLAIIAHQLATTSDHLLEGDDPNEGISK